MASKFQLQIPEPCHENWNEMTPVEQGRYCGACQQNVVDFTGMSDAQLITFFKKPSTGSVCGRFNTEQLHREIVPPQKRLPWFKYFFQLVIPAFLLSQKAVAQGKPVLRPVNTQTQPDCTPVKGKIKQKDEIPANLSVSDSRKGRIVTEKGEPVPYATVISADKRYYASSDAGGWFIIPERKPGESLQLEISSVGYLPLEVLYAYSKENESPVFVMKPDLKELEPVMVTSGTMGMVKTAVAGGISFVQETSFTKVIKDSIVQFFTKPSALFPNPVARGQNLNIQYKAKNAGEVISIRLLSSNGQLMKESRLTMLKGNNIFTFTIETRVNAGLYHLVLVNQEGKAVQNEQVVVQ